LSLQSVSVLAQAMSSNLHKMHALKIICTLLTIWSNLAHEWFAGTYSTAPFNVNSYMRPARKMCHYFPQESRS